MEFPRATFDIVGITNLSFGKNHGHPAPKKKGAKNNDDWEEFESKVWRDKMHCDEKTGHVFVPPFALSSGLSDTAKLLGENVKGKGKATYTKRFMTSIVIEAEQLFIINPDTGKPYHRNDDAIEPKTYFCNSNGTRGSGTRVNRTFPEIRQWRINDVSMLVLNVDISKEILLYHAQMCGQVIGIGRYRPQNGGTNGRFLIENFRWKD